MIENFIKTNLSSLNIPLSVTGALEIAKRHF